MTPSDVKRAWFLIEPFGGYEGIGHTFLSFEFEDGITLVFSVQARQERGEAYSAFRGLLNMYELAYQWGTERDFIARRLLYLDHELRMYPLEIDAADTERLLRSLLEETDALAAEPRFYNTLTANCTNMLAHIVNKHYPGKLPYDLAWNLTGYADLYLMDEGLISMEGSKEEARARASLTPHKAMIEALAEAGPSEFSATSRELLQQ
jgi:hypothetical protein